MLVQFLAVFIPLLSAHLLADFVLQSDASVAQKKRLATLLFHGVKVGFLSYLIPGMISSWQIPVGIAITHMLLDAWKLRATRGTRLSRFVIDQSGHITIIGLFSWAAGYSYGGAEGIWTLLFGRGFLVILTFLSGAILAVYVGSFIVELAFESLGITGNDEKQGEESGEEAVPLDAGIAEGGRVIGYLERGLILLFILVGYPAGIGFLVAAKSIFRFGELSDSSRRSQAEYIIIGTLLSILYGTVVSYLTAETIHYFLS